MIELYQSESCPYSAEVREKLSTLGVSYVAHNPRLPGNEGGDVTNAVTHDQLTSVAEDSIPYLVDTDRGETLQDTDEILQYLEDNYA